MIKQVHTQATNANLMAMWNDAKSLPDLMKFLLKNKLKEFLDNNAGRIDTIMDEVKKLQDEYFVVINEQIQLQEPLLDAKGDPVPSDKPPMPKMLDGKKIEDYQAAYQKLMSLPTTIK